MNIVELIAGEQEDGGFNQHCKHGYLVEGHAVYCHNSAWSDSPTKCRRTWYTGGEVKDEECPGYRRNSSIPNAPVRAAIQENPCSRCGGRKLVVVGKRKNDTCPNCEGDGHEPTVPELTEYEVDTLSLGHFRSGGCGLPFVRIATNDEEKDSIWRLAKMNLLRYHSATRCGSGAELAYLLEVTGKGNAVLSKIWEREES